MAACIPSYRGTGFQWAVVRGRYKAQRPGRRSTPNNVHSPHTQGSRHGSDQPAQPDTANRPNSRLRHGRHVTPGQNSRHAYAPASAGPCRARTWRQKRPPPASDCPSPCLATKHGLRVRDRRQAVPASEAAVSVEETEGARQRPARVLARSGGPARVSLRRASPTQDPSCAVIIEEGRGLHDPVAAAEQSASGPGARARDRLDAGIRAAPGRTGRTLIDTAQGVPGADRHPAPTVRAFADL